MLSGQLYIASDRELTAARTRARLLMKKFNDCHDDETVLKEQILYELIGSFKENLYIEAPFYCDYGSNIQIGKNVFFNFGCTILDVLPVVIGDDVLFGPNVQIYTATHPLDWQSRAAGLEFGKPITIGSNVWIGGGVIICPGVSIGDRSVIGAGSIVTKNIPPDTVAAGNPCKPIRSKA